MGQSITKGNRVVTTGALSLVVMLTLLLNDCSGNPIGHIDAYIAPTDRIVEVAGMGAYYEEGRDTRILGVIINEYQYYKSHPAVGQMGLESARVSGDKQLARQSVCFDNKKLSEDFAYSDIEPIKVSIILKYNFLLSIFFFFEKKGISEPPPNK